jgi:hypothetical protein
MQLQCGLVLPEASDMCITSSSSSSSMLSPTQRDRLLERASRAKLPVLDCADECAATHQVHEDGLLNRNRLSFAEVDFCFVCECALRMDDAHPTIECTGMKSDQTHYGGQTVPVYRQLFACDRCYVAILDARKRDPAYRVKMVTRALVYFR